MVAEVDDLDAVADEFEVDRVDGAVVAIADRHGGEQTEGGRRHAVAGGIYVVPQTMATVVVMLPPTL